MKPMTQAAGLADQIRRAFEGNAWHGDSVLELLVNVDAAQAAVRPVKNAHTIWELVLHIAAWDDAVLRRTSGKPVTLTDEENFPPVKDTSEGAWRKAIEHMKGKHDALIEGVAAFPDTDLTKQVPGKSGEHYNFYYMFSGIVQHELYHAGQIALLKKML
jgi:uncharacterized damage-inducible protein DinB